MQRFYRCAVLTAMVAGWASLVTAGDLTLTLANGRATLIAQDEIGRASCRERVFGYV